MSLFSFLFRKKEPHIVRLQGDGDYPCEVVGESKSQIILDVICGGKTEEGHRKECIAVLRPEPENPYDQNAIAVFIDNHRIGYLCRAHAKSFSLTLKRHGFDEAKASALIVGGWRRSGEEDGYYGVRLDIPVA